MTGSHAFKTGVQWHWGSHKWSRDANADLDQRYRSGVPDSVIIYNTPTHSEQRLNADLGAFVQDSWTFKRLTLNGGVRFEYFNSSIEAVQILPGRFIGSRDLPGYRDPEVVRCDAAVRSGLRPEGRRQDRMKVGVNKYMRQYTTGFAARYDPSTQQTDVRDWRDQRRQHRAGERDRPEQ